MMQSDEEKQAASADSGSEEKEDEGASSPSTVPPVASVTKPITGKGKKRVSPRKKKAKRVKKPKDMPRRPLSAYNIFFREERERMLKEHEQNARAARGEGSNEPLPEPRIGFENMAKTIGKRWKALSDEEMARYKKLAMEDMERYRRERDNYQ